MIRKPNFAAGGWRGLVLPLLLLALWQWASMQGDIAAYVFVPLSAVWKALGDLIQSGDLWANLKASLARTCTGLGMGLSLGIATGSAMALSRIADRLIAPLYTALRQIPILGLVPLFGLWFGDGEESKLLLVSLAAFYPVVLNTYEGLRQADRRLLEVGTVLRLSRRRTFVSVLLPSALPSIFTGISQAIAFSWLTSIGAEIFFSLGPGIGSLLLTGQTAGRMEIVLVSVMTIALIGYAMNTGFNQLKRRLMRWTDA